MITNYRILNTCSDCKHCFIKNDYDCSDEYFCLLKNLETPRPKCGSVAMDERFTTSPQTVFDVEYDAWFDWEQKNVVNGRVS